MVVYGVHTAIDWSKDTRYSSKTARINEEIRKQIKDILVNGFKGELQLDGTTRYISYQQIVRKIKGPFNKFACPAPQQHIRNRVELVAITETRDAMRRRKMKTRSS